ncbi:uncharacterized protein LOC132205813 [Neocloeon triangulifer]|uniref:uncharacterized protein LOC132205813 n=1 Tax=Neocloeon triangulifer TaxID=2078957 RepID=UPI00286ED3B6|nr:uncharacterized protein LOC132205813 [Neocloeon triangulifer]
MEIAQKLDALLSKNFALPVTERLALDHFVLDREDFETKLRDAEREIKEECSTLEKEAAELERAADTVLRKFLFEMEEPSREIKGFLSQSLSVRNFALVAETVEEDEEFRKELMRNEMYVSVTRFIAFSPWELMSDSELAEKQHKSPLDLRSFKSIAEGFQKMLSDVARRASDVNSGAPAGSISRSILSPDESQALALLENCDQA